MRLSITASHRGSSQNTHADRCSHNRYEHVGHQVCFRNVAVHGTSWGFVRGDRIRIKVATTCLKALGNPLTCKPTCDDQISFYPSAFQRHPEAAGIALAVLHL